MPKTYELIGKTVTYLKRAEDGFYYLGFIDVYAVSEKYLFDETFTKKINVEAAFTSYEEACAYMNLMGLEVFLDAKGARIRKVAAVGSDVIE